MALLSVLVLVAALLWWFVPLAAIPFYLLLAVVVWRLFRLAPRVGSRVPPKGGVRLTARIASCLLYGVAGLAALFNFLVYWQLGWFGQDTGLSMNLKGLGMTHWWSIYWSKVIESPVLLLAVVAFLLARALWPAAGPSPMPATAAAAVP